jgi:prolipoprotein diacylglyceryltransferase
MAEGTKAFSTPPSSIPNGWPEARHPSQLFEAALEGLLLLLPLRVLTIPRSS